MSEITQEQFVALEAAHGAGMVLVLSVGEDEFAFRRPSDADVEFAMDERDRGVLEWMEHALISCALCPATPHANAIPANKEDKPKITPELVAVRQRIQAIWAESPFCRDSVPLVWAQSCGWGQEIAQKALGGGKYELTVFSNAKMGAEEWSYKAAAMVLSGAQYEKLRKLGLAEGTAADRFAFTAAIGSFSGIDREEFARRYPFAVLGLGQLARALGSESRAVSVKKYNAGSAQQPGISTSTPANG